MYFTGIYLKPLKIETKHTNDDIMKREFLTEHNGDLITKWKN